MSYRHKERERAYSLPIHFHRPTSTFGPSFLVVLARDTPLDNHKQENDRYLIYAPVTPPENNVNGPPGTGFDWKVKLDFYIIDSRLAYLRRCTTPHWNPVLIRKQAPQIFGTGHEPTGDLDSSRVENTFGR